MTEEREVHADCSHASNLYHECSQYCFKIIAEAKYLMHQGKTVLVSAEAAQGSGSSKLVISNDLDQHEEMRWRRPDLHNDAGCHNENTVKQNVDIDFSKLSEKQKRWLLLRNKMQEAKKRILNELAAETKEMEAPEESDGTAFRQKWFEKRKKRLGKIFEANRLDMKRANMLETAEAAELKCQRWEKDPAPIGWEGPVLLDIPLKVGRRKRQDFHTVYSSDCSSPKSYYSEMKTLDSRNEEDNHSHLVKLTDQYADIEDEAATVMSGSRVMLFGRYHVNERFASIMQSIFDTYGDITANCQLQSDVMRSFYLECVCFTIQELNSISAKQLTKCKVKELLAILRDVEYAQIKVSWLRCKAEKIDKFIDQYQAMEVEKAKFESEAESTKKQMDSELEILAEKEKEFAVAKARVTETRERLKELEFNSSELNKNAMSVKSKVGSICLDILPHYDAIH